MRVWNERELEPGVSQLDAETGVGFSFLRERFATRVRRDANARRIEVQLLNGPFRRLHAVWSFEPHPVGTALKFDIDFEFKAKLLEHMVAANFERATSKLMACFETRANALFTPLRAAVRPARPGPESSSRRSACLTDSARTASRPMSPKRASTAERPDADAVPK